ncbi:MAG: DinB family protein [Chitinophagaceae bacterium]
MTDYLELLEKQRAILLKKTTHLTTDQYNLVPRGFNNNIIWNMGHSLVVSESLLYSNTPFKVPLHEFDIEGFQKGTKPELIINDHGISLIRKALSDTVPLFKKSFDDFLSANVQDLQDPTGSSVVSEKHLHFMLFHEDMHMAVIQRLLQYA